MEYCLQNLEQHRFGDVNPRSVEELYARCTPDELLFPIHLNITSMLLTGSCFLEVMTSDTNMWFAGLMQSQRQAWQSLSA